jgi:integrase/recombinase XerD
MYLDDILRERYAPLRRLSPRTLDLYAITLRHFDRWLATVEDRGPGPARVDDLTDLVVARFVAAREVERCAVTAKKDRTQLLALWRYCARKRLVDQFPELPPMRVPERIPRAYTAADLDRLLEYFAGIDGQVADVSASSWWSSLVRVLFETGGRITETLSAEWTDLDLDARTILLRAENRKARTRDIVREISTETAATLSARRRQTGRVWPWGMTDKYLWAVFKRHCGRAGVTYRRGFHAIRKASCSYTAAAGGDATALADHADAATTRRHYLDPAIVKVESNLARLPRLGGGEAVDTAAGEEQALRAGYQTGIALASAGVPRPDAKTTAAIARSAGFATHVALYGHGIALGWGGHSSGDSAGETAASLAIVTQ